MIRMFQDHKTRSIEYSHATCLWIVQIHCIYVHVMGIFALFLFFSQVILVFICKRTCTGKCPLCG